MLSVCQLGKLMHRHTYVNGPACQNKAYPQAVATGCCYNIGVEFNSQ